jgi:RNA polymerase sigma factor (sigma-70 family)
MAGARIAEVLQYIRGLAGSDAAGELSDAELLRQFIARHDEAGFAILLQRHGPLVLEVCRQVLRDPHDAEDAFQAVFLVLARKAASIRRQESLAAWLHRVALNVSRKARAGAARRQALERHRAVASAVSPADEVARRDWQAVLHEEVDRLPEKYRAAVIVCYQEGNTHDEAARQLGWPLGTVKGRLARARDLLRSRLARRGVTLSVACAATAVVPEALAASALRAAMQVGLEAGLVGGLVMARVALLVGLSVLAVGLGVAAHQTSALPEPGAHQRTTPESDRNDRDRHARTDLHGDPLPAGAVARLGTLRFRHGKGITAIALSPDGKTITSTGNDGSLFLHDATTGEKLRSLAAEPAAFAVALAPDGRLLTMVVGNRRVSVRETATGKQVRDFPIEHPIHDLIISSDGRTLLGGGDHVVHVWDIRAGTEVCRITPPGLENLRVALSPDGKTTATAGWDRREKPILCLWDTASGRKLREWQPIADLEETHALAFSPDGKRLVSTSGYAGAAERERLRMWAVPTAAKLLDLPGRFHSLDYSPGGKLLAARGAESVSLLDADTGKEIRQIPASGPVSFSADSKVLAVAAHYSTITFWDVASGKQLRPPPIGHGNSVRKVQFLLGGKTLASLGDDAAYFWNVDTARNIGRFDGPITQRALSPDGKTLAALFWQGTPSRQMLGLWDTASGKKLRDMEPAAKNGGVMELVFSPDGKMLVVGMGDRTIQFWDVATGKVIRELALAGVLAQSLAFSPDGKTLAVANGNLSSEVQRGEVPTVWLVDAVTGRGRRPPLELPETAAARDHASRLTGMNPMLAFSADGKVLAAAASSGGNWGVETVLQVWDLETGHLLCRLERVSNRFALSPDGKSLITTIGDPDWSEPPRLWEVATGKLRARVGGHLGGVHAADFSPDGRLLATGSQDTTVLVWDVLNLDGDQRPRAELSRKELEDLWSDLAGANAARAYRAMRTLVAEAGQAVPFLRQQLRPIAAPAPERLARLIADLDDGEFRVREKATHELEKLGPLAWPALRKTLAGTPSPEVRRRAELLLSRFDNTGSSAESLRAFRAVEVLELLATSEARRLLESLAAGAPEAILARDADRALARLSRRAGAER